MSQNPLPYPFEVRPLSEEEGGGFSITFPDLPGCRSDGEDLEEVIENGRQALEAWLAVAKEFGDQVPKPYSAVSGRFVQRVPRSLHAQLISQAEIEGVSLNTLVVSLVSEGLGRRLGRTASGEVSIKGPTKSTPPRPRQKPRPTLSA